MDKLVNLWEETQRKVIVEEHSPANLLFKGIYESKRMARTYGKQKVVEGRKREVSMEHKIVEAQFRLEANPQLAIHQVDLEETETTMKDHMERKLNG